jgi:WD40 repeat protein
MPEQFEKLTPEERELTKIKPTPVERKEPIELTEEENEYFINLLKQAKEAEKRGDLVTAIQLYQQYKQEYLSLREKKEGKEETEKIKKNYEKYECIRTLKGLEDSFISLIESRDGKYIISGSYDGTIKIWNKETGECIRTLDHGGWVNSVIESHDGKYIISCSADGTIKIWGAKEE